MTPARFVEQARLEAAKVLLATGDHGQEAVARRAGFGSADTMRRTFRRALGVSPVPTEADFAHGHPQVAGRYQMRIQSTSIEIGNLVRAGSRRRVRRWRG